MREIKEKHRKKKFYPRFEPQHVEVILYDRQKKINRHVMLTRVRYNANMIQIYGEV